MEKCVKAVVTGRVQGVYFRAFTQEEAIRLQLTGWVRNLASGEVETLICGPVERIDQMLAWLASGSPQSRVDQVTVTETPCAYPLASFTIRY